jgi:hypothetical protein
MKQLIEYRDLYESSVLGSYDCFLIYIQYSRKSISAHDVFECILEWNRIKIFKFIEHLNAMGGIEILSGNRIFVVAPNPKINHLIFPWRVTHYYKDRGPICEEEFTCAAEAIIYVLLSYPESKISNGMLDSW